MRKFSIALLITAILVCSVSMASFAHPPACGPHPQPTGWNEPQNPPPGHPMYDPEYPDPYPVHDGYHGPDHHNPPGHPVPPPPPEPQPKPESHHHHDSDALKVVAALLLIDALN